MLWADLGVPRRFGMGWVTREYIPHPPVFFVRISIDGSCAFISCKDVISNGL